MRTPHLPVVSAVALLGMASCTTFSPPSTTVPANAPGAQESGSSGGIDLVSRGVGAESYVSPVSQPTLFETAAIQREIRPMFMHQELPSDSAFQGGNFQVYAVQARVPLNDRFAIIATKDGFIDFNPDSNPFGGDETGFADIAAGVKYAAIVEDDFILTPGITYEIDSGDHDVFQGRGDGVLRPFVSVAKTFGKVRTLGTVGYSLPIDDDAKSTYVDYHAHADYDLGNGWAPLIELHGITYTKDGNAFGFNFEGGDLVNLGSGNVEGQSLFIAAFGGRFQASQDVSVGATWEIPMGREDLHDGRLTVDAVIVF